MKKFFVLIIMSAVLYTGFNIVDFVQGEDVYHYQKITVHTGDTMWEIAGRWTEEGEDVRAVIYRICEANDLHGNTSIVPGQKILVPVRMQFADQIMVAEANVKG